MKTLTLKEVSKKINIKPGTLKKWEKELHEFLVIPRTKQGARIYSESEIQLLLNIKQMYANKFSKELIGESLQKMREPVEEVNTIAQDSKLPFVPNPLTPLQNDGPEKKNADQFFEAMDAYKQTFLNEIREEIRTVLRKEVVEEVKKEISNGTFYTVKSLADSIYKSTAHTRAEIDELSGNFTRATKQTSESLENLSTSIARASVETAEEIFSLSRQLSETTEELSQYVDVTNTELFHLSKSFERNREDLIKEREHYRHEIRQREAAFQNMLTSFRDVAAGKEKKWWKFWTK